MSPGNNESGGKKKPGSTTYGNECLKTMLTEFAWVASKTKDTYLRSKYHSLMGRRGKKKALVALGHKILIMCYRILKYRHPYIVAFFIERMPPPTVLSRIPMNYKTSYLEDTPILRFQIF